MGHIEQQKFISLLEEYFTRPRKPNLKILEVGSYCVNLSVRDYFKGCDYLGVDLVAGPGVDLVCSGHELTSPDSTYDLAISCEAFEHDPNWDITFRNMYRVTKPGGMVIFTCASSGRIEHGTRRTNPNHSPGTQYVGVDYYRNLTERDFQTKFDLKGMFSSLKFFYNSAHKDLYFCGWKNGHNLFPGDIASFVGKVAEIPDSAEEIKRPFVTGILLPVYEFPIKVACRLLSDSAFQNFRYYYWLCFRPVKAVLRLFGYGKN